MIQCICCQNKQEAVGSNAFATKMNKGRLFAFRSLLYSLICYYNVRKSSCLDFIDEHRDDLTKVSANAVIRHREDRSVGILVYCDNAAAVLHTRKMLYCAGDSTGNVDLGTYRLARLTYLMIG